VVDVAFKDVTVALELERLVDGLEGAVPVSV
jgi:hypothetical protein